MAFLPAELNIPYIFVTLDTSHFDKSPILQVVAFSPAELNIPYIFVTLDVSKFAKFPVVIFESKPNQYAVDIGFILCPISTLFIESCSLSHGCCQGFFITYELLSLIASYSFVIFPCVVIFVFLFFTLSFIINVPS